MDRPTFGSAASERYCTTTINVVTIDELAGKLPTVQATNSQVTHVSQIDVGTSLDHPAEIFGCKCRIGHISNVTSYDELVTTRNIILQVSSEIWPISIGVHTRTLNTKAQGERAVGVVETYLCGTAVGEAYRTSKVNRG